MKNSRSLKRDRVKILIKVLIKILTKILIKVLIKVLMNSKKNAIGIPLRGIGAGDHEKCTNSIIVS